MIFAEEGETWLLTEKIGVIQVALLNIPQTDKEMIKPISSGLSCVPATCYQSFSRKVMQNEGSEATYSFNLLLGITVRKAAQSCSSGS